MIHILPFADSEDHDMTVDCRCEPKIVKEGLLVLVVHNRLDGKKQIDWTKDSFDQGE